MLAMDKIADLEEKLLKQRDNLSIDHDELWQTCRTLISTYNQTAMELLNTEHPKDAGKLFRKALKLVNAWLDRPDRDDLAEELLRLKSLTFNNMGCYHKRHEYMLALVMTC